MPHNNDAIKLKWLHHFPELAKITDIAWLEAAHTSTIPLKTILFRPGDPCMNFVLVVAGKVRVYIPSETGREIVLYHVEPGEICVLTLSNLLGGLAYTAEGVTEMETQLVSLSPKIFEHALTTSNVFRRFIFSTIGIRLGEIMHLLEEITFKRLDIRLAQLLVREAHDNEHRLVLKTHQDLAAELGSSREVISRLLKRFEHNGWLKLDRTQIHVVFPFEMMHSVNFCAE